MGKTEGYDTVSTLAFDRIEDIKPYDGFDYKPNVEIDFNDDYFSDMIGVTKPLDETKRKVRLKVSKGLYPYIATKPLHETQKIKGRDDAGVEIEIEVYINYELKQLILSYGDGIKVLSPESLRNELKTRLENALMNYD